MEHAGATGALRDRKPSRRRIGYVISELGESPQTPSTPSGQAGSTARHIEVAEVTTIDSSWMRAKNSHKWG